MEGPARMACEPGADLVLLECRVVVEDHVDGLVCRHLSARALTRMIRARQTCFSGLLRFAAIARNRC